MHRLRLMRPEDIAAVDWIQAECYSAGMQEAEATIRARLQAAPDTAWVAEDEAGVFAYLFAYRSRVGKVTPLDGPFSVSAEGDALYLHDLAVSRRGKGLGAGKALVDLACAFGREAGLAYSALVSVQGSRAFWERLGYSLWEGLAPAEAARLLTYEGPAYYMVRPLGLSGSERM